MVMISVMMIIIILDKRPLIGRNNIIESINEIFIILVCYHLILVSDFAPQDEIGLK